MPITVHSAVRIFTQTEFHTLAEKIIGIAFNIHNTFGRLLDETFFKNILQHRCIDANISPSQREVKITVHHDTFSKDYYMDLLFASGLMVEAKTVERLTAAHIAQTLNYLLLTGMHHSLLFNFRPGKVEKRFVSTELNLERRRNFVVVDTDWSPVNEPSARLRTILLELLADWGGFLQTNLYREALIHFFGGPTLALRDIPIFDADIEVGSHETFLICDDTGVAITGLKDNVDLMQQHLMRFLEHTQLKYLQWINLNHHDVEFWTLVNQGAK